MTAPNPNPAAFPSEYGREGMTLRDYFAGEALGALIQSSAPRGPDASKLLARAAYRAADAMLEARQENN